MSILNNGIIKYAFDNAKGKNDMEDYKKLLVKYRQVLDWYRQDLQEYNHTFLNRNNDGKISLNQNNGPIETSELDHTALAEIITLLNARIDKVDTAIDAISKKLELIDNSLSDYVYSDPVYPEIHLDEVLDKLQQMENSIKSDLDSFVTSSPIHNEDANPETMHSIEMDILLILKKLEGLDKLEYLKELEELSSISASLDKMNFNFHSVVQHLNKVTDKIILFEKELKTMETVLEVVTHNTAPDQNTNQLAISEISDKLSQMSSRIAKLELDLTNEVSKSLKSLQNEMTPRMDSIQYSSEKSGRLFWAMTFLIIVNVVVIGLYLFT